MPYRNGRQGMASGLQPTSAKSYISLQHGLRLRDPPLWGLEWRSPRSSLGCGGTRTSHLRSTSVCWRHSARRLSTSSEWSLTWNGERTETHSWCCTVPLFVPSLTMVVYGTASNTNLRQLDSIHNCGLRLALGAFCTSPVSSLHTEDNEAPLEERRLKLSMHYYVKTRACIDNPAHHALHEFDRTTRDLYVPRPNGRGGMTRTPTPPTGLKVEEAMTSAEINAELVCPLRTPNFPPGTHDYDPKRHDLIEGVSKCMISRQEAQAKFNEFREAQGSHDEVYTDGSKMNERVGAAAVINRHFQNGETTCRQLSKRLPDNSTIFAAEATAISLVLNYYQHMGPVHHDVVVYSDSMSCLQATEGEDTENPFICHIMNLLCRAAYLYTIWYRYYPIPIQGTKMTHSKLYSKSILTSGIWEKSNNIMIKYHPAYHEIPVYSNKMNKFDMWTLSWQAQWQLPLHIITAQAVAVGCVWCSWWQFSTFQCRIVSLWIIWSSWSYSYAVL